MGRFAKRIATTRSRMWRDDNDTYSFLAMATLEGVATMALSNDPSSSPLSEIQEQIDAAVHLLMDLKSRPGLSASDLFQIDRTVERLQKCNRALPELTKSAPLQELASDLLVDALELVIRLFLKVFGK